MSAFENHTGARVVLAVLAAISPLFVSWAGAAAYKPSAKAPPPPAREYRGAWVASVSNIDWPSKPGLTAVEQKAELIEIINRAAQAGLNTIVLQVRPGCDALYASKLEPWSEYLTGEMGKAPSPFYDPLEFAIAEAHARGMEFHAWINPFRARHPSGKSAVANSHLSRVQPGLVKTYGRHLWMNPAEEAAQQHSLKVVLDIVRRYDVDGLHMDDYFYPYKEKNAQGQWLDFPDDDSWESYVKSGGRLNRADWRRANINRFVEKLYGAVKQERPWVKVGISPFGIWRPGVPQGIAGYDAYENLYADSRTWLTEGWLDYFAPQLYWSIDAPGQSYAVLLKWWGEQNPKHRHICPGINSRKVGAGWATDEIVRQIELTRQQATAAGNIHWSIKPLRSNQGGLADALRAGPYAEGALVPVCSWLPQKPRARPKLYAGGNPSTGLITLTWESGSHDRPARWVLQSKGRKGWQCQVFPGAKNMTSLSTDTSPALLAVYAMDRYGNLSPPTVLEKRSSQ